MAYPVCAQLDHQPFITVTENTNKVPVEELVKAVPFSEASLIFELPRTTSEENTRAIVLGLGLKGTGREEDRLFYGRGREEYIHLNEVITCRSKYS